MPTRSTKKARAVPTTPSPARTRRLTSAHRRISAGEIAKRAVGSVSKPGEEGSRRRIADRIGPGTGEAFAASMIITWVDQVYQHPNFLILAAGPEITVRQVATRALTRDDAQ
jgi:hypothetical protein